MQLEITGDIDCGNRKVLPELGGVAVSQQVVVANLGRSVDPGRGGGHVITNTQSDTAQNYIAE